MTINIRFTLLLLLGFLTESQSDAKGPDNAVALSFVENIGQLKDPKGIARGDIDFRVNTGERSSSVNVYVSAGMLHYQWVKPADNNRAEVYQMRLKLIGANTSVKAEKEQEGTFYENYYIPSLPQGSRAMGYGKVVYKNIYPNIDWMLYSANGKLKYDFVVHEGGDVRDIKLQFEGNTSLRLREGKLVAANSYGSITEDVPYAYEAETKRKVRSKFVLKDGVVTIATANHNGTLVIDPEIIWRTYYGGWQGDMGTSIAKKPGNGLNDYIFVAGGTQSWQNIILNPHDPLYPGRDTLHSGGYMDGNYDGFIAAYTLSGRQQWALYYGGEKDDIISDIEYGISSGSLFVGGRTKSTLGIATPGTHKQVAPGSSIELSNVYKDGFLAKFDGTGVLQWGTYYGGEEIDFITAIAIDDKEDVYAVGETNSTQGIATAGAFSETQYGTGKSGVVAKFSSGGQLIWGTYFGDYAVEEYCNVTWDGKDGIYVVGSTSDDTCGNAYEPWRDTMIGTPGTYMPRPSFIGCPKNKVTIADAFLLKFNINTGSRIWGTFFGYHGLEQGLEFGLAVVYDSTKFVDETGTVINGLVYMGGSTTSLMNIATPNGQQTNPGGGFIAAFRTDGTRYWSTYTPNAVTDMQMDSYGQLVTTQGIYKHAAKIDAGVAAERFVIDETQGINYYYGTGNTIALTGVAIGNTIQQDTLADFPAIGLGDAYITRYRGEDKFLFSPNWPLEPTRKPVKYPLHTIPVTLYGGSNKCVGGGPYNLGVGVSKPVFAASTPYRVQMADASGDFRNYRDIGGGVGSNLLVNIPPDVIPGSYRIRLVAEQPLCISDAGYVYIFEQPEVKITSPQALCEKDTLWLTATDTLKGKPIHYQWVNVDSSFIALARDTFITPSELKHSSRYIVTSIYNDVCYDFDTLTINVHPLPTVSNVTNNSPVCAGSELKLSAFADTAGGAIFNWSGPGFNASGQNVSLPSPQLTDAGMYKVRLTKYGCSSEDSTLVLIDTLPATPEGMANGPLCHGDTLKLFATGTTPGVTYLWRGPGNFSSTLASPVLLKMNASGSGVYTVTTKLGNCTSVPDSVEVIVPEPVPAPEVSSNSPVKEGDVLRLYANGEPGASYAWVGPDSFSSKEQNPLINDVGRNATGVYHVSATVNGCGSSASTTVVVNGVSEVYFLMFPNPNDGTFRIKATMDKEQVVPIQVLNVAGQLVYETEITSRRRLLDTEINLPGSLSSGKYHLRLRIDGTYKVIPFVIN